MTLTSEQLITNPDLKEEDVERASHYLSETRDLVIEAASGLSDAQWKFKSAPECWSIADIVEHVVLVEGRISIVIAKLPEAPAATAEATPEIDEFIMREVTKRTQRVQAPPHLEPTQRWSGPEALEQFVQSREQTRKLLSAPFLRGRVIPHPVMGPWEGYQWILAAGAHSARHARQIQEVKSAPGFPV